MDEETESLINKALEGCLTAQAMIDINADHLDGLRTQCATSAELTQHEIRALEDCTTLEQRAVIRFLNAEGIQTSQICQRMKNIYGESCLSQKNIYKWVNEFKNGRITCSSGLNVRPVDGPICLDFLSSRQRMNSDLYCDILVNKLKPGIRNKRRGKLSKGVLFLHDNARPHTSCKTVSTIIKLGFEVLEHPAYSPDLAPSDYFLFGLLKKESDLTRMKMSRKWCLIFFTRFLRVPIKRVFTSCQNDGDDSLNDLLVILSGPVSDFEFCIGTRDHEAFQYEKRWKVIRGHSIDLNWQDWESSMDEDQDGDMNDVMIQTVTVVEESELITPDNDCGTSSLKKVLWTEKKCPPDDVPCKIPSLGSLLNISARKSATMKNDSGAIRPHASSPLSDERVQRNLWEERAGIFSVECEGHLIAGCHAWQYGERPLEDGVIELTRNGGMEKEMIQTGCLAEGSEWIAPDIGCCTNVLCENSTPGIPYENFHEIIGDHNYHAARHLQQFEESIFHCEVDKKGPNLSA
ncbi:hypothetical protein LAZ67_X003524 [Cordylochernes scorpioides]|uniref:Kinase suppressor RAS 1 N-terminal helical hairpin domain-containing protein n=1 Tax=Cordylochernes scorpioides TaxID=51811 RepID=A0ABY6LYB4_9ARAC|nr:hypothetical protein LAZ67_X003524 [Cordylochernes scorpioides]